MGEVTVWRTGDEGGVRRGARKKREKRHAELIFHHICNAVTTTEDPIWRGGRLGSKGGAAGGQEGKRAQGGETRKVLSRK